MSNKYYVLVYNPPWAGPVPREIVSAGGGFLKGFKLSSVDSNAKYILEVDEKAKKTLDYPPLDYFMSSDLVVFFSEKLKTVLNSIGVDNVDYYQVEVTYAPTNELIKYDLANVIGSLKSIDRDNSIFVEGRRRHIRSVEKMVLDESSFEKFKLFRCSEFPTLLIINDLVKEVLEENKITGMKIVDPSNWQVSMV